MIEHEGPLERPRLVTPAFLLITFSALAYFTAYGAQIPILPRFVRAELGGGSVAIGFVVGAFSITAVIFRPYIGRLGDARGRKLLILGGASIVSLSIAGFHLVDSLWMAIALRLVAGVGEAAFFVGAASAINDLAPDERRGEAVSFFTLSLYAGLAIGPLIGETVFGEARNFAAVWSIGALGAVVAATLALRIPDTRPSRSEILHAPTRLLHPAGILPGVLMLTSVWAFAGYAAFMPLYALDLGMKGSGLVFLVYSTVIVAIRFFGATLPDRLGHARTATFALGISTGGLVLIFGWASQGGLFLGSAMFAVGQALAFPALLSIAVRGAPPSQRGSVVGTFTMFVDVGFGLGPVSLGVLVALFDFRAAFLGGAVVAAGGLAGMLAARNRERREDAAAG